MSVTRRAFGYVRVSTSDQGESGLGLEAQRSAIAEACASRDWELTDVREEVKSGGRADNRPVLQELLGNLRRGDALVVARLDRLTRSLLDWATLLEDARRRGWTLVVVEQGFDLGTPTGRAMAGMLAVFAQFERELIGERTREALAAKRAEGWVPHRFLPQIPPRFRRRVRELAAGGLSQRAVAAAMSAETGSRWHRSTVARILGEGDLPTKVR